MDAEGVLAEAPFRLLGHLDLGDQPARRRIPAGEVDAGCFADHAASAVAPDEIFRPQRLAVGQLDVDAGVVLREARHFTSAIDRHRQLADPLGQDALDVVLPQPEPVVVPGGEVADVERDHGEARDLSDLSLREEPIGDSALIEDLDGARVQAARARADELLAGAPLDNGNVDARQRQLARQHQPRRTSSGDHHRMLGHRHPPIGTSGMPTRASSPAQSGGAHTRTIAPKVRNCTASPAIGSTSRARPIRRQHHPHFGRRERRRERRHGHNVRRHAARALGGSPQPHGVDHATDETAPPPAALTARSERTPPRLVLLNASPTGTSAITSTDLKDTP